MANERRCENCTKECPKAKVIREIAEGRMWATKEFTNLQRKIDNGTLVEVVFCKNCEWRDAEGDCLNPKCGKSWYGCPVSDEHYCSYGERKEGSCV